MTRVLLLAAIIGAVLAVPAQADASDGRLTITAKITSFSATRNGIVANGIVAGSLASGEQVVRDRGTVRFKVSQKRSGRRCNVLILNLQKLHLELLGAVVDTSAINLELYAKRGAILGNLFCSLSRAKVKFPRVARALNARLDGRPLRVMAARSTVPTRISTHQGSCQVLELILGPLHLDLLGLNVDLYGKTKQDPVVVTIAAEPGHGLLGDVLCAVAGGANITSLAALQDVLRGLGVSVADVDLQNLLNGLGLGDLSGGLSQLDLNRILAALGVTPPAPTG